MKNKVLIVILIIAIVFIVAFITISYFLNTKGSIFINSFPQDSEVYIDGKNKGTTPLTINNLSFGEYEVQVKHDGYRTFTKTADISMNKPKVIVIANLEHITFILQVSSYPTEAEVYVDGTKKGLTPITIDDLSLGEHFVEVKKANFSVWSQKINVNEYKVIQLIANLQATAASIKIDATPKGAKVLLNGKIQGTTPLIIKNLDADTYVLDIQMNGYIPYKEKITLNKGEAIQRNITLKKINTMLNIDSKPSGSKIYINGKDMGITPYKAQNLKPGKYSIKIEKDGYLPFSTQIIIKDGDIKTLVFPLLKLPSGNSP